MAKNKGDLFNIDNIEEAIKAIEEIYNIIQKTGVSAQQWMNDNEEIVKKYNELKKLSSDLFKQDEMAINARNQKFRNEIEKYHQQIKFREEQIEQEVQLRTEVEKRLNAHREILNAQKEEQQAQKDSIKYQKQLLDEMKSYKIEQPSFSLINLLNKRQNTLNSDKSKRSDELINDWISKNGSLNENNYSDAKKYVQTQLNNEFGKRTLGLSVAAQGLQTAGNILQAAGKTLYNIFRRGINKQSDAYENSFTNISVRNGTTRSQYYGAQANVNNVLSSMGLNENIGTSQVQEMWNTLASEGIKVDLTDQETTAKSIETILTNQIVPYLDMSSSYMQKLSDDNPTLMKQVRGIGTSIQNVEGSNVVANEYLQDMMNSLSPMAELANQEIGLQYADTLGQLENLRNQGYSDSQIGELYGNLKTMVDDPYAALTSGDTMQRITTANMLSSGADLHDSSAWLRQYMYSTTNMANQVPEGNWSSLYAGVLHSSLGGLSTSFWDTTNVKNINPWESSQAGYSARNGVNSAANTATESFRNNENQTNMTLQNITIENFMNELSVINEWLGNWTNVAVTAINGIKDILITIATATIGSKLIGGKSSGLLSGIKSGIAGGVSKIGSGLSSVGYQALNNVGVGGTALNMTTGQLAATGMGTTLGAAGLVAGGTALGLNGVNNVISDVSSGNINAGTGFSTLQGVAGLGAAGVATGAGISAIAGGAGLAGGIAAAATNPVGWALLAAAGIGLAGKAIYDATNTTVDLTEELQTQKDNAMKEIKSKNDATIDSMYEIREQIKQSTSYEEAKNKALQSGIVSQEDLNNATDKSVEGLLDLADASIQNQKDLNDLTEQTVSAYTDVKNGVKDTAGNSIMDILNIAKAGGKSYNDMSDEQKTQMNEAIQAYIKYVNQYGSDEQKAQVSKWGTAFDDSTLSKSDFNKVFDGSNKQVTQWFENFVTSDKGAKYLSEKKSLSSLYGDEGYYSTLSDDQVQQYITSALQSDNTDDAKGYLKVLKSYGLTWDKLPSTVQNKLSESFGDNISSYRQGINDVPQDQLAYLHQGEAVLTASTANELRNMTDVYRETTTQSASIDVIIQNQTNTLITKMDEIIRAILTGTGTQDTATNTSNSKLWNSMINMQSTKNF